MDLGEKAHYRALERLYAHANINRLFPSSLALEHAGQSVIRFEVGEEHYHAAGAAHGTVYFKMLDDAAFYAANSLVTDRFLLTTSFNMHLTAPLSKGALRAEGQWISGKRRVLVAESRLIDQHGEEVARATGTFMRSRIALSGLEGYVTNQSDKGLSQSDHSNPIGSDEFIEKARSK